MKFLNVSYIFSTIGVEIFWRVSVYVYTYIYIYIPSICRSELGSSGTPSRNKKHSANE